MSFVTMTKNLKMRTITIISIFALTLLLCITTIIVEAGGRHLTEEERLRERNKRGHKWPFEQLVPNTQGWRDLYDRRFRQVERIADGGRRYEAWLQTSQSAAVAPNFTESGWGLTRAPKHLIDALKQKLHDGLPTARSEGQIDVIETEYQSLFIDNENLNRIVLNDLKPLHEAWSGLNLTGSIAYGLRAYQNNSRLLMHIDKSNTHIISSILHIDKSEDSEPWPIVIEDFHGNTNEVYLTSGDMLFYESSKCFHGRPRKFSGSWYSSIFIHYYPKGWNNANQDLEGHYAIPPHWNKQILRDEDEGLETLQMVGTSMKEPECEDVWCAMKNSVKYYGPAPGYGKVLSANGVVRDLENIPREDEYNPIPQPPKSSPYDDEL